MGDCRLCGQPAGFLRSIHAGCQERFDTAVRQMAAVAENAIVENNNLAGLTGKLAEIAQPAHVPLSQCQEAIVGAWERTVEHFLEDGELSATEEEQLAGAITPLSLSQELLDRKGAYGRLVKAGTIRDLLEGRVPKRLNIQGSLPFNLQKAEVLLWVFPQTSYLEDRVRREYVGRSQGVSFRIMKGVYYRTGTFRGHPVETSQRVHVDDGLLGITNRHVYFAGPKKSLRVRHDKIISLIPFEDGVGIHRDAMTAKPQIFVTGDGWFTYNMMVNASNV